jgi:TatD DNase family protein
MEFVDTHCHIHFKDYGANPDIVIQDASKLGVSNFICVGCSLESSRSGIEFVNSREGCWVSIGIHPHDAKDYYFDDKKLADFSSLATKKKVVAVGECGLDYYYMNSPINAQINIFKYQIELAVKHDLPLIFHVRDAFDDFWKIIEEYKQHNLRGVVHSFSDSSKNMRKAIENSFYIGLNGIVTFSKDNEQIEAFKSVPLKRLLLETDAPYLTPAPYRGNICKPEHVVTTAKFIAELRGVSLDEIAASSTHNAKQLFGI